MKQNFYLLIFLSSFFIDISAQNETANWYFGQLAGITFTTTSPTILTNGAVNTTEGTSSASDANGNLLFYTNGVFVYNRSHALMANGSGLFGGSSTSQALIVKQPGNTNLYYLFTLDYQNINGYGLNYSIVDMSLASGMGSVTVKNDSLHTPSTEKMTAVKHCNGKDVWILTHDWLSADFRAYLLTASGLQTTPVITTIGTVHTGGNLNSAAMGGMKFSPNGKKLAVAYTGTPTAVELYDFDNITGAVSNSLVLVTGMYQPYSCEFSPDGTKLYATGHVGTLVYQWDLCAGSSSAIIASQYTASASQLGALQIAPNGKIYISRHVTSQLGVINNPNLAGAACNYVNLGQSVSPKSMYLGLPSFVTSYFDQSIHLIPPAPGTFTAAVNCNTVGFTAPQFTNVASNCTTSGYTISGVSWNFGDPASGASNTSALPNPVHLYSTAGTYTAMMLVHYNCTTDTVKKPITVAATGTLSLLGDSVICRGESPTFTVGGANTYSWSTGSTASTVVLTPMSTTNYTVKGFAGSTCTMQSAFTVSVSTCIDLAEVAEEKITSIFPNPLKGETVTIVVNRAGELRVYNGLGLLVLNTRVTQGSHELDLSNLNEGIYFFQIKCGDSLELIKLVKTN